MITLGVLLFTQRKKLRGLKARTKTEAIPKDETPKEKEKRLAKELKATRALAKKQEQEEKDRIEAERKLQEVRKQVDPAPAAPPMVAVPLAQGQQGVIQSLEEFPLGQKLNYELTRIKEGTHKRILIVKGQVAIKPDRFGRLPTLLFFVWNKRAYFVNPKKIIKVTATGGRKFGRNKESTEQTIYKLVYDVLYSEPLNQDGTITWDEELEMVLADSGMDQYVVIASSQGGFVLSPTLVRVLIIIGFIGLLMGLALNGSAHIVPITQIHWLPR